LSDTFQNGLEQGDALLPFLFKLSLECTIGEIQGNREGLILNGIRQLLVYADGANLFKENINTSKTNTKVLSDASTKACIVTNAERTKYVLMCRQQKAGQNHNTRIQRANT
jgi:hypothetical protein